MVLEFSIAVRNSTSKLKRSWEAAALALRVLREQSFDDDKPMGDMEVHVTSLATKHTVSVQRVKAWLSSNPPSPKEHALKARLQG